MLVMTRRKAESFDFSISPSKVFQWRIQGAVGVVVVILNTIMSAGL